MSPFALSADKPAELGRAYLPKVRCAKCAKFVTNMQRSSDGRLPSLKVRCHGEEAQIGFASGPDQTVTLW